MADNLKPCPFCGGPAERIDIDEGENAGGSCVQCASCLASSNVEFGYKENFIGNWNRRTQESNSMAETLVEKLRARAEWWEKLEDYVVAQRDEARGTQWFARFNSIAHSIRGRIAVEEEAADTIIGLARRGAAAQWRPFSEAPESRDEILVYRPDAGVFMALHCEEDAYTATPDSPPEGDFYWFSTCGEDLTVDLPTHWMPLPPPPEKGE